MLGGGGGGTFAFGPETYTNDEADRLQASRDRVDGGISGGEKKMCRRASVKGTK